MRYVKQRLRHDPDNGVQGDCFRTVVACLLDLDPEDVPHFMDNPDEPIQDTWRRVDAWLLEQHGLRYLSFPFQADDLDAWLAGMMESWPGLRWELAGTSPRETQHSVIVQGGEIIHDPHPDGGGIVAPGKEDGWYWMGLFVPVSVHGERT